jgi:hypothetical protein
MTSHDDSVEPEDVADREPAGPTERPADPEVPEADGLEQRHDVSTGAPPARLSRDLEVPEADALEQAMDVLAGDEEYEAE